MNNSKLKRLLITAVMLCLCAVSFAVSVFAGNTSNCMEIEDGLDALSKGDTICIGKINDNVIQWQLAYDEYCYNINKPYSKGNLLISKYLLAADSMTGTAAGTYSQALSTLDTIYSTAFNEAQRNIVANTILSDSEYTAINCDEFEDEEENTYDGYSDIGEPYEVLSPDKNQTFKADDSALVNSKLFLLSAEEVQKYIDNEAGDETLGLNSVVRRPCFNKFSLPSDYTSGTLDNRDWWLRSEYKTTASKRAVVQRVIRKDTTKYNSLNTYGLIGNRSEKETAWLRPAMSVVDYDNISFIFKVELTTETDDKFVSNTTKTESRFLTALKTEVSKTYSDASSGNAWMIAYKTLDEISVSNVAIGGDKAVFSVSGLGDNKLGYMVYSSGIKGTQGELSHYGCASKNAAGNYVIPDVSTDDYIYVFAYKVGSDDTLEASTRMRVQIPDERYAARISSDLLTDGRNLIINGYYFTVLNALNVDSDEEFTFKDNNGNVFDKDNDNGLLIGTGAKFSFKSLTSPITSKSLQAAVSKAMNFIYPYETQETGYWETPDHGDYYKEARLGTDYLGNREYAYSMTSEQITAAGLDSYWLWARDDDNLGTEGTTKNLAPAFNLKRDKVAFVYKSGTLDNTCYTYLKEVKNNYTQDSYEMAITLPDEYNTFNIKEIKNYDSSNDVLTLSLEGIQADVQGYKSSVAIIGVESTGVIRYYTHVEFEEYGGETYCYIRIPYDKSELKYMTFYAVNELQGYNESSNKYIDGTKFVSSLQKIDLKFATGTAKVIGNNYPGGEISVSLYDDCNISLDDPDTQVTWEFHKDSKTIKSTGTSLTIPEDAMPDDDYVSVRITNSNYIDSIYTTCTIEDIPESAKKKTIVGSAENITNGDTVYYGDIKDTGHSVWKNSTAIQWTVISRDAGNATGASDTLTETDAEKLEKGSKQIDNASSMLLLSKYSIGTSPYNRESKSHSVDYAQWEYSDIQEWCQNLTKDTAYVENGELEASLYLYKEDAEVQLFNGTLWAANKVPNDRFFMLSIEEISNYIAAEDITSEEDEAKRTANDVDDKATTWWSRTARPVMFGTVSVSSGIVNEKGEVVTNDVYYPNGLRPAVNIDKDKVAMYSYAVNGKNGNIPEIDDTINIDSVSIEAAASSKSDEWKLTIYDSAHSSFKVDSSSTVYNSDGTRKYTIEYSGAQTSDIKKGYIEYISLIRKNKNGNIIGYHKIAVSSDETGKLTFTVPKANATDTDYVINERCYGNYQTDYCSSLYAIDGQTTTTLYIKADNLDKDDKTCESLIFQIVDADVTDAEWTTIVAPTGTDVKIADLIVGHSYYIKRVYDWSWRYPRLSYTAFINVETLWESWPVKIKIEDDTERHAVECGVLRDDLPKWLCGENYKDCIYTR